MGEELTAAGLPGLLCAGGPAALLCPSLPAQGAKAVPSCAATSAEVT